jgi:cytochrome c-type biogenesis protein CcmH
VSADSGAPPTARVGGVVTLAPALRDRVSPDDTVFVFARAAGGPRMPLAVLRKQVKDLPLRFTLDDSLAMSPAASLSKTERVVVGARVARGGGAQPRDGDLQGLLPAMALGRDDLRLEINEVVRLR